VKGLNIVLNLSQNKITSGPQKKVLKSSFNEASPVDFGVLFPPPKVLGEREKKYLGKVIPASISKSLS